MTASCMYLKVPVTKEHDVVCESNRRPAKQLDGILADASRARLFTVHYCLWLHPKTHGPTAVKTGSFANKKALIVMTQENIATYDGTYFTN
jgi:hypothetical protein